MTKSDKADSFEFIWRLLAPAGSPEPEREYRFCKSRRFQFDFAWPCYRVAVEVDGGQWVTHGGRHARDSDREKLNLAAELGWRVLRYSPQMIDKDPRGVIMQVIRTLTKGNE